MAQSPMEQMIMIIGKTSYDKAFRERFIADPRSTLAEEGLEIGHNLEIVLVMGEPDKIHIIVPYFTDQPISLPANHPIFEPDKQE